MPRPKIGAFIRKINYLGAKDENEYSDKLMEYENKCDDDEKFNLNELKDGYAAFREKVCVPNFPSRHSGPYWAAYATAEVLERLAGNFEEDDEQKKQIGHENVYTWLALLCAKPSSGHLDLMSEFTGDLFEEYLQGCNVEELVKMLQKMKIKFSYDSKETENESTYAGFLSDAIEVFFKEVKCREEESPLPKLHEAFLDLQMFYQKQLSGLSPTMAKHVENLVPDQPDNVSDNDQHQDFTNLKVIKSQLSSIGNSLCTFEGDLKTLGDEDTLKQIIKALFQGSLLKDVFSDLMDLIVRYSKRKKPLENGDRIFDLYRITLFGEISAPDSAMFSSCVTMLTRLLTDGRGFNKAKTSMMIAAHSDCILKTKKLTPAQGKTLIDLCITMIKSGRIKMVKAVNNSFGEDHIKKLLVWKDLINEAKAFLVAIGTLTCDQMEESDPDDYDKVTSQLEDTIELLLEMLRKGKVLNQIQKELVTFVFNCLDIARPHKFGIASNACEDKYLIISSKNQELIDAILDRSDKLLKQPDMEWNNDSSTIVPGLLSAVINSYNGDGKKVTASQNDKFMSIFASCCEGDSLEDKMLSGDEDVLTVYYTIYISTILVYIAMHLKSKTLPCCIPVVKLLLKWARIAVQENHEDIMTVSFGGLQLIGSGLTPEMADIAPEVVDMILSLDEVSNLISMLYFLYPLNPEPIHSKLQLFVDKIGELSNHSEKLNITNILNLVAGKHPKHFTDCQVGQLIQYGIESDQNVQMVYINIIRQIAEQCPKTVCSHFSKLANDTDFHADTLVLRLMTVTRLACYDKTLSSSAIDYVIKHVQSRKNTTVQQALGQAFLLARNDRESMEKHKGKFEKLEQSTIIPEVKESCRNIINAIEGKSIEGVFEDIQQTQEDIADLDVKVGATINTVVSLGDHVIEQSKDISKVQKDVDILDERVEVVEDDLTDTKIKVEDIDNKTMTNAPKWSRDLTKLLNPVDDNDWRLLAKRFGYSNDDIRGWAQQNDPCMALLSEWYATHKTSEATFGLLTHLQEMNRLDGAAIVENAMKASEGVVEDEDFEYASPPPIFLSYQWGMQEEVKLLKQHLNMAGYECWMDIGQMGGGDKLFNKIDTGVRASKIVICCTTEKYAQSPNCNREVNLSVNLGKPIIPLLMEKMPWPPKGSMGPIFSEYLFIRFFQRDGEETKDNTYWPLAKFQELLMQMNFYVVPDQALIKPVYSNWWAPITEEVKIKKNKTTTDKTKTSTVSTKADATTEVTPLVFLSYQWGKQPQVKALYNRLVSGGYSVWMDIFQMGGGDSLYDKIDRGMRGCKVVVTCITTKYALSANCRREVSLADALKKPMVPLLLEEMKWPPPGPMSLMFTELLYINMYRDLHVQEKWTGAQVNEMFEKLQQYVPAIAPVEKKDNHQKLGQKVKESPKNQAATGKVSLKKDEPKSEHITTTARPPDNSTKKRDTADHQKTETAPVEKKDNHQKLGQNAKESPKNQAATGKASLKKDEPKSEHITTTARPPDNITKKRNMADIQNTDTTKGSPKPNINHSKNGLPENTDQQKQSKSCIVL